MRRGKNEKRETVDGAFMTRLSFFGMVGHLKYYALVPCRHGGGMFSATFEVYLIL